MRQATADAEQPAFNDIRIDLRNGGAGAAALSYPRRYAPENDQRSQGSVPSRISRYSGKFHWIFL